MVKVEQSQSTNKGWLLTNNKGFSLVEALLGVSIFGLLITGLIGAFIYGQETNVLTGNRSRAIFLAEEGLEIVSNIRDQNFGLLWEGDRGLITSGNEWILSGTSTDIGIYKRSLDISVVDNLTKTVITTVIWSQNRQRNGIVTMARTFANWLVKTLSETTQAAFNLGNINSVETVNDRGGEIQNVAPGDWSGILLTDEYDTDSTGDVNDLDIHFASQQMVTVANNTSNNEFNIFDISDISNTGLSFVSGLDYAYDLKDVSIYDGYAYVATEDANELLVIRLSDVTQVNVYDLPSDSNAEAVKVIDGVAYIGTDLSVSEEFYVLDVSDPEGTISEMGAVEIGANVSSIDISGGYAYLATSVNTKELTVIRLSDYANVNSYSTASNDMYDVVVKNNKAYLAGAQSAAAEVYIIDVSSPEGTLGTLGTAQTAGTAYGIAVNESNIIFVASSDDNNEIYSFDGDSFAELSTYDVAGTDNYFGINAHASYVYTTGAADSREIVVLESSLGWQYRKSHTINGTTAGAQTNFPIQIFVYYGSGTDSGDTVYCNSNCQADFGDVRFTNSNGDELDYFMDEAVISNYARFWVEVDSIPASPASVDIYMMYSNDLVETTSNGANTFEEFLDYGVDGVISYGGQDADSSQYEVQRPNPPNNSSSTLRVWGNVWKGSLHSITINGDGSQYLEWWYNSTGVEGEIHGVGVDNDDGLSSGYLYQTYGTQTWGITADVQYDDVTGGWQLITQNLNDYSGSFDRFTTIDDADAGQATDTQTKNVRIRTRVSPEPTHGSWGSQETGPFGVTINLADSWQYRKSHTINGTTAGAQTNFPIQIFVYYGSGTDSGDTVYCNSNCQADFGDVRFTNSSEVDLDYFMDEAVISNYARFWVEVDSIPASPASVDIYMIYGNDTVDTTSNGSNTFEEFVDYSVDAFGSYGGQDTNSTQYAIQTPNPPNNEDSQLRLWGNNWKYSLHSITVNGNGTQYLEWWYNSTGVEGEIHAVGVDNDNGLSSSYLYKTYGTQTYGNVADTQYNDVAGGWQLITHSLDEFSGSFDRFTTINDADAGQATDNQTRNIRIRTRVTPEPTHGFWGSQETLESVAIPMFIGAFTSAPIDSGNAATTWTDVLWQATSTDGNNYIKFQMRTAPDSGGSPGTWGEWFGPEGRDSFFSNSLGDGLANLLHRDGVDDQWAQYRAFLYGTIVSSPVLESVDLRYNN